MENTYLVSTLLILIILYSLKYFKEKNKISKYISNLEESIYSKDNESTFQTLEVIKKIEEIKKINTPWYERQVSIIGTAAFIGMTLGASTQLYENYKNEKKLESLKTEISNLEEKEELINKHLLIAEEDIIKSFNKGHNISQSEKKILEWKIDYLTHNDKTEINESDISNALNIFITIGDFKNADRLIQMHQGILDTTNVFDLISLAEYFYIKGFEKKSETILDSVNEALLPVELSRRYYAVYWSIYTDSSLFNKLSARLGIDINQAERDIRSYSDQLERNRRNM